MKQPVNLPAPQNPTDTLFIPIADFFRATLAEETGNSGFIGIAPDWSRHHVVAPVDRQIARGVKAANHPIDGTPFGGYAGWRYFECPCAPAGASVADRWIKARQNAELLVALSNAPAGRLAVGEHEGSVTPEVQAA